MLISRGANVIVDELGYRYSKHNTYQNGDQSWRCSKFRTLHCKVFIRIRESVILDQVHEHNHDPS